MAVQVASCRRGESQFSLRRHFSFERCSIRPSQTETINAGCVVATIGHPIELASTCSSPAALTLPMKSVSTKPRLTSPNSSNRPRLERRDANRPSSKSRLPISNSRRLKTHPIQSDCSSTTDSGTELSLEIASRHYLKILTSFKKHPFLIHGDTVLKGFIRRNECLIEGGGHLVPGIIKLCASYYVDSDAGIFQIAFKLHRVLKKAKRRGVTMRMAQALLDKYLEYKPIPRRGRSRTRTSDKVKVSKTDIEFYCTELIRLGYLMTSPSKNKNGREMLYWIPMEKVLEFSCIQH